MDSPSPTHRFRRFDRDSYSFLKCRDCGQRTILFHPDTSTPLAIAAYQSKLDDCGDVVAAQVMAE